MKIRHYILIILSFTLLSAFSQTIRFSNQYPNNGGSLSVNLFSANNKYYLFGITSNTILNKYQGFGYLRTDSNGNLEVFKETFDPNNNGFYSNSSSNSFCNQFNKYIVYNGLTIVAPDHFKSLLVKFDLQSGDTIWKKIYNQVGDSSQILTSLVLNDTSIICFGFRYYIDLNTSINYHQPFMLKVDKNGNYKWHKYLSAGYSNYIPMYQKAIALNDNDFVVVGYKYNNICYPQSFIMRLDTNINITYNNNLVGLQYPVISDAIILNDGALLLTGGYAAVNNCPNSYVKWKKFSYKAAISNGNKISSKVYNLPANGNVANTIGQHANGIIYIGGATTSTAVNSTYYYADVLKITSNLDSITTISFYDNTFGYSQSTNQLIMTPDGGFAAVLSSYPTNNQQQKFWLVKADSSGCYTATCPAVGIKENNISDDEVTIYPNPANELINVIINDISGNKYQVQILNTLGQLIREEDIQLKDNTATLQLNDLPNGVYTLCLKSSEGIVLKKKMVIGR